MKPILGAVCLLALFIEPGSAADAADRNPFARPSHAAAGPAATQAPVQGPPSFDLRATMAAGADSLVNIDGRIIAIGAMYAGYRLVSVGEGTAVFMKNGVRYPMSVASHGGDQG